jgi:hypothetical protein
MLKFTDWNLTFGDMISLVVPLWTEDGLYITWFKTHLIWSNYPVPLQTKGRIAIGQQTCKGDGDGSRWNNCNWPRLTSRVKRRNQFISPSWKQNQGHKVYVSQILYNTKILFVKLIPSCVLNFISLKGRYSHLGAVKNELTLPFPRWIPYEEVRIFCLSGSAVPNRNSWKG